MKKVPACFVQFLNCNCIFPEGSSPLLVFFVFFCFFFFLNLETWLLWGLLFLARLRREASWGLRGTKAGGGWRIIISFPCLFNDVFHTFLLLFSSALYLRIYNYFILMSFQWLFSIFSFTLLFCNILVHNHLILMYFQKILSILFFLVTITF